MTAATVDEWDQPSPVDDFRRDRWDRPLILQPDGTRIGYTRSSTAAKTIEDTYNLVRWDNRNIAYGLAYDASLVARLIAIGGNPGSWTQADKELVNALLDDARKIAQAHKGADIGSALHHLTHRLDRGEDVDAGPYEPDLEAYVNTYVAHGICIDERYIECRIVNDLLRMAGSADRIVEVDGVYRIADIKTGATVDFGGLGWAAQLAAYAGGVLYDVTTETRLPTPPIDQTTGYIIHLPAGQGRCDIYEVDLVAGHRAAELANEIRSIRKAAKQWITPKSTWVLSKTSVQGQPAVEDAWADKDADSVSHGAGLDAQAQTQGRAKPSPASSPPSETAAASDIAAPGPASGERPAGAVGRAAPAGCQWCGMDQGHTETCEGFTINDPANKVAASAADPPATQPAPEAPSPGDSGAPTARRTALLARYHTLDELDRKRFNARRSWDPDDLDEIEARLTEIEATARRSHHVVDGWDDDDTDTPAPAPTPPPDEGEIVDPVIITRLKKSYNALSAEAQTWVANLVAEGNHAGVPWNTGSLHSVRRYQLGRAIVALANYAWVEADNPMIDNTDTVGDEIVRGLLEETIGGDILSNMAYLGAAIGHLDATEATRFATLVDEYLTPHPAT